jgi:hypothetical protein
MANSNPTPKIRADVCGFYRLVVNNDSAEQP